MPELPDLQVFSRNIEKEIAGKKVKRLHVPVSNKLKVSVEALKKELVGQVVKKSLEKGKSFILPSKMGMFWVCI